MIPFFVQATSNSSGSGGSTTIVKQFVNPVTPGNRIVACVVVGSSSAMLMSLSDSVNGATNWRKIGGTNAIESAGPTQGEIWELPTTLSGTPIVTATFPSSQTFCGIGIIEVAETDLVLGFGTARTFISTTAATTLSQNTPLNNCYVVGLTSNDIDSVVPTATSPFTLRTNTSANQIIAVEDLVVASKSATNAAFTYSVAKSGIVCMAIFSPKYYSVDYSEFPETSLRLRDLGTY